MDAADKINDRLGELGRRLGIGPLARGREGNCALGYQGRLTIVAELPEASDQFRVSLFIDAEPAQFEVARAIAAMSWTRVRLVPKLRLGTRSWMLCLPSFASRSWQTALPSRTW